MLCIGTGMSTGVVAVVDAQQKTIDVRVSRLEKAVALATGLWLGEVSSGRDFTARVMVTLLENRSFVQSHASSLLDRIVRERAVDDQDRVVAEVVAPLWDLVSRADVALARIRVVMEFTDAGVE